MRQPDPLFFQVVKERSRNNRQLLAFSVNDVAGATNWQIFDIKQDKLTAEQFALERVQ